MTLQEEVEAAAKVFEALAHPTRVHLMRTLGEFPNTPSELARQERCSWTTIAKHLKLLEEARLVKRYRAEYGTGWVYVVDDGAFERVERVVAFVRR